MQISVRTLAQLRARTITNANGCWEWQGPFWTNGYARMQIGKRRWLVHRYAYLLFHDSLPDDLNILHSCDNRCCVNPDHLFPGTQKDNIQDMLRKGREAHGIRNGHAHHTDAQIMMMRELDALGMSDKEICRILSADQRTVSEILFNDYWKHVPILRYYAHKGRGFRRRKPMITAPVSPTVNLISMIRSSNPPAESQSCSSPSRLISVK